MAGACILGVIISKLGYWQESWLIILFEVDKISKIGLYGTILLFCLIVCLRMEGNREFPLDAKKVAKKCLKLQDE